MNVFMNDSPGGIYTEPASKSYRAHCTVTSTLLRAPLRHNYWRRIKILYVIRRMSIITAVTRVRKLNP